MQILKNKWLIGFFTVIASCSACAGYVGESFLKVPGIDARDGATAYSGWLKFESREWVETSTCPNQANSPFVCDGQMWRPRASRLFFSAPWAPQSGAGKLAVALDKNSAEYTALMAYCQSNPLIPELVYAESAELSRRIGEVGGPSEGIPDFFEYKLIDVTMVCPQVSDAPEQAVILAFKGIEWLNIEGEGQMEALATAVELPPLPSTGASKTYLMTWIQPGGSFDPNDCPQLNKEPGEDEYFALWSQEKIAAGKKAFAEQGGLATLRDGISFRGPEGLSVCALPGIVPDPGHAAPQSDVAIGFNLDGYDGNGDRPAHVHDHKNFVSEDGRKGIDNQLYTVEGCVPGFRPEGNIPKVSNEMMRNGSVTVLINIAGIDNTENDDSVAVSILFSKDLMVKMADGSGILPNYTFRLSDNPEFTQFSTRFNARIEEGVVITDALQEMTFQDGGQNAFKLFEARMRLELLPDYKMKAVVGGYHDWRRRATNWTRNRILEPTMRFQCPGLYHAYKRAADGLWDAETKQFNGISVAYKLEGVRAFIPPSQLDGLFAVRD